MRRLTHGQAPLRGGAALELVLQPVDYRQAATLLGPSPDLALAVRAFSVIGGVVGYATDMVDNDLPRSVVDLSSGLLVPAVLPRRPCHPEEA